MLERLFAHQDRVIRQIPDSKRSLYHRLDRKDRLIGIKGPRGAGKTTLLLQLLNELPDHERERALYISADHAFFYDHGILEMAEFFHANEGRYLFLDEVHKYPGWSNEIKNIYDGFPDMNLVFSASSALDLFRGEADLSRRLVPYELPGLSFREYLNFKASFQLDPYPLERVLGETRSVSKEVLDHLHPLPWFERYLKGGSLPMVREMDEEEIPGRLLRVISAILENDLAYVMDHKPATIAMIKRLLAMLAASAPFKPNISSLARKLDVSRDAIYAWFQDLEKAGLINSIQNAGKGSSMLQKPDKVLLENSNLAFALNDDPEAGSLRESFIVDQLLNSGHRVEIPKKGDFLIDGQIVIEVGGRNKDAQQIQGMKNAFLAIDDIEQGYATRIPLWLFGFLY